MCRRNWLNCVACKAKRHIGITLSCICLSVCLSGSTFLVVRQCYVSQANTATMFMICECVKSCKFYIKLCLTKSTRMVTLPDVPLLNITSGRPYPKVKVTILMREYPENNQQETAKDGMAGLQSGNKIWEDWLRTSLNAMVNLRHCMTLKFEWTKSRSKSGNKIWEAPIRTNLNAKDYLHVHVKYCKNIKWPWTEKVKVRVTRKCPS